MIIYNSLLKYLYKTCKVNFKFRNQLFKYLINNYNIKRRIKDIILIKSSFFK